MGRGKGRRALLIAAVVAAILVAHDASVSPRDAFGARAAVSAIDAYRANVSPRLRSVVTCRFVPSCSQYGRESILKHGLLVGGARTIVRLARCGPWTKMGTVDLP